jgi:hypothetical protein
VDLVELRNAAICEKIAELGVLPLLFDKFFEYDWNSALHSTVIRVRVRVRVWNSELHSTSN